MTLSHARQQPQRAAILRGGTLFFAGKTVPCLVRALSETGARLVVYSPDSIPRSFRLYVELARMEVDCELAWRRGKEIGVNFTISSSRDTGPMSNQPTGRERFTISPSTRQIPILIAEDDPDDRHLISSAFTESALPCDLSFVPDGEEALRYLASVGETTGHEAPQLILLDLNMPKIDGRTVLRHVKANALLKRIPVVVFTTSNSEDDIESTYDLGVSSYIVKPSHYDELLDVVQMLGQYWGKQVLLPRRS